MRIKACERHHFESGGDQPSAYVRSRIASYVPKDISCRCGMRQCGDCQRGSDGADDGSSTSQERFLEHHRARQGGGPKPAIFSLRRPLRQAICLLTACRVGLVGRRSGDEFGGTAV